MVKRYYVTEEYVTFINNLNCDTSKIEYDAADIITEFDVARIARVTDVPTSDIINMLQETEPMCKCVFINTSREGYEPRQCPATLSVGELRSILAMSDDDMPVYLRNDKGYTFGSIGECDIFEGYDTYD